MSESRNLWTVVKALPQITGSCDDVCNAGRLLVRCLLGLLVILVVICPNRCYAANGRSYEVYIVTPAINNYAILADAPLPKVCKPGSAMHVMACRGQYEAASFVVTTTQPLKQVKVTVSPLVAKAGTIPAAAVDVRLVWPYFRNILDTWPTTVPWLLVHNPKMFAIEHKLQPIALRPFADARERAFNKRNVVSTLTDARTLQPVDIAKLQQFWITVHVPTDAKAGTYLADILVTPQNAAATRLTLQVKVPEFTLLPPLGDYSIYYPTELVDHPSSKHPREHRQVDATQYLLELKDMVAHGCTNPNIYWANITRKPDGSYDFSHLEEILRLREQAGIHGQPLYLVADGPVSITSHKLSDKERAQMTDYARRVTTWAKTRGYPAVYFMAEDEARGERLRNERASIQAFHAGGGKVFVACGEDFYKLVGDVLDTPVMGYPAPFPKGLRRRYPGRETLLHPEPFVQALSPRVLLAAKVQKIIQGVHKRGFKIFTYFDPVAGCPFPEVHRRIKGVGMWESGLDGTMTWAYSHINKPNPQKILGYPAEQDLGHAYIWRGKNCVIDTLAWEGYREGVDDARYLATLQAAVKQARHDGRHPALVKQAQDWLNNLDVDTDLDAMRQEAAKKIEALQAP